MGVTEGNSVSYYITKGSQCLPSTSLCLVFTQAIASSKPAKHQLTPAIPTFLQERDGKLCPIPSLVLRLTLTNQTCLFWTTSKKPEKLPKRSKNTNTNIFPSISTCGHNPHMPPKTRS